MSDLFESSGLAADAPRPLADRLRPLALDQVVGQDHLLAPEAPLGRMVARGVPLRAIVRPMLGLVNGRSGARRWRRMLSDAQRLNAAVQILQSELNLAGSQLRLSENTDLLTQLYEILSPGGSHVDPIAMVTFNHRLAERMRKESGNA